jgi:hypothetical protein
MKTYIFVQTKQKVAAKILLGKRLAPAQGDAPAALLKNAPVLAHLLTDLLNIQGFARNGASAVRAMRHTLTAAVAYGPVKTQRTVFYADGMAWTGGNTSAATGAEMGKEQ